VVVAVVSWVAAAGRDGARVALRIMVGARVAMGRGSRCESGEGHGGWGAGRAVGGCGGARVMVGHGWRCGRCAGRGAVGQGRGAVHLGQRSRCVIRGSPWTGVVPGLRWIGAVHRAKVAARDRGPPWTGVVHGLGWIGVVRWVQVVKRGARCGSKRRWSKAGCVLWCAGGGCVGVGRGFTLTA
jgi:hypothetical protein